MERLDSILQSYPRLMEAADITVAAVQEREPSECAADAPPDGVIA